MMTDGPSGLRKQAISADALGLNQSVHAVTFPAPALTASSFDRTALTQLGQHLYWRRYDPTRPATSFGTSSIGCQS